LWYKHVEIVEITVQHDHVHVIAMLPPKLSITDLCVILNGRTSIRVFNKFRDLKKNPISEIIFAPKPTHVDTVRLDSEIITKYV
jgi:putative transposase